MSDRVARLVAVLAFGALAVAACDRGDTKSQAAALFYGDPDHGPAAIRQYGCGTCHMIPGVPGAEGKVGPPLAGIVSRAYVAGVVPNSPANIVRWIRFPQAVDSLTAMPTLGVTEQDARDIASYLYTLK